MLLINACFVDKRIQCLLDKLLPNPPWSFFFKMYLSRYCASTKVLLLDYFFLPQNADHATKPILKIVENLLQPVTLESATYSKFCSTLKGQVRE